MNRVYPYACGVVAVMNMAACLLVGKFDFSSALLGASAIMAFLFFMRSLGRV